MELQQGPGSVLVPRQGQNEHPRSTPKFPKWITEDGGENLYLLCTGLIQMKTYALNNLRKSMTKQIEVNRDNITQHIKVNCRPELLQALGLDYKTWFSPYGIWPLEDRVKGIVTKLPEFKDSLKNRQADLENMHSEQKLPGDMQEIVDVMLKKRRGEAVEGVVGQGAASVAFSDTHSVGTMQTINRLRDMGIESHAPATQHGSAVELRQAPQRQIDWGLDIVLPIDRGLTEKILESYRMLRGGFAAWGSGRYFDLVWSQKSRSPWTHPLDVKHAAKSLITQLFFKLNVVTGRDLTYATQMVAFGVLDTLIYSPIVNRDELYNAKLYHLKQQFGEATPKFVDAKKELDKNFSKESLTAGYREMTERTRRFYLKLHNAYFNLPEAHRAYELITEKWSKAEHTVSDPISPHQLGKLLTTVKHANMRKEVC